MAFSLTGINRVSAGANTNAPAVMAYATSVDTGAQVGTAGYFNDFVENLRIGTIILVKASDGTGFYQVTALDPNVTVSALATIGVGGVGAAQIQAGAVDTVALADDAVDSSKLDATVLQYLTVPMTAAQFNGMYAAPFEIIPAPGADKLIVVDEAMLVVDYGGAAFAAGGVAGLQYGTTANGAGPGASETFAAAVAQWAADSTLRLDGRAPSAAAANTVNKSICMSNLTAAFTTGSSAVDVHIWYKIITAGL